MSNFTESGSKSLQTAYELLFGKQTLGQLMARLHDNYTPQPKPRMSFAERRKYVIARNAREERERQLQAFYRDFVGPEEPGVLERLEALAPKLSRLDREALEAAIEAYIFR